MIEQRETGGRSHRQRMKRRRSKNSIRSLIVLGVCGVITAVCLTSGSKDYEDYIDNAVETQSVSSTGTYSTDISDSSPTLETEETESGYTEDTSYEPEPVAAEYHEEIQTAIDAAGETYGAVGIQVAVIENGVVSDTFAYGWATVGEEAMTAEHKMRVASISKVVIGMAAMLLQEDGIIDLDADIGAYWNAVVQNPAYPDNAITIRSMLTHTSSIICYGDEYSADYESVLQRFSYGYDNLVPGSIDSWCYNNYVFRVLGMTLELAANQSLDDILQEKLYAALEIDASFASGDIAETDKLVTLYRDTGEISRTVETQKSLHMPEEPGQDGSYFAGGLTISAADLAKLVALLASDGQYNGTQLLDADSIEEMEDYISQPLSDGSYQAMPLFYRQDLYGRDEIYYHTGTAYGVYSCISYDPNTGDGIVVLTTGADGSVDECGISKICSEINSYIYNILCSSVS